MNINRLSSSSFDCYSECNWKYFLSYVCGIESDSGPAALLGTIAHKFAEVLSIASMQQHDHNSKIWDPQYLWKICFNHYYNKESEVASQIKKDKIKKVCDGLIVLLDSTHTPVRTNTIGVEQYFKIPMQGKHFTMPDGTQMNITGRIDRVDKLDEETIEIVDYKSGMRSDWLSSSKEKIDSEALRAKIQGRMYHLAGKTLYPWAKNILINFYYITDGGSVPTVFDDTTDIQESIRMLQNRYLTIKEDMDPRLNRSWRCKLCYYEKMGICADINKERNENGFEFVQMKYTALKAAK